MREIGGAVLGLWPKYMLKEVAGVAIFLDATNRARVSETVMELYAVLRHQNAQVRPRPFATQAARISQSPAQGVQAGCYCILRTEHPNLT